MASANRPPVNCPHCKKKVDAKNPSDFWPFCSKRCKLIDLGEWASESYRIPGEKVDPHTPSSDEEDAY